MRYGEMGVSRAHWRPLTPTKPTTFAGRSPWMSELPQSAQMRRINQAERILTYVAVTLAALAAAYLLFTLLSEHEVCYGMQADKLLCQPVDGIAAARGALVLLFPGILFVGAAVGALWQTRATTPDARSTAFGLLVSSTVVLIGIVVPALAGAGFFLAPATALMTVVALLGTVKFVLDWRTGAAQAG